MSRSSAMIDRLPSLYRDGELVGGFVDVLALQNEILDEETFEVQRAHWFDTCLNLNEAAALAEILDITPEPWQSLAEFRPWVHALRDARLKNGSVTVAAIRSFIETYTRGFERANRVSLVRTSTPTIVENPTRLLRLDHGPVEPLEQITVNNAGLDAAPFAVLFVGLGRSGPEYAPMIANLTTGATVAFRGVVPPGKRLTIRPLGDDVVADLEGDDVSEQLRVIGEIPLRLSRGLNHLQFMPLAHYDTPGLDRFLLELEEGAVDPMRQGRYSDTKFDSSLFAQDPAAQLAFAWLETMPATFRADLTAPTMRSEPGDLDRAVAVRDELTLALETALKKLSAAGVRSSISLQPLAERQPMTDRLRLIEPLRRTELGSVGADRLPDSGGVFDVTDFDGATLR